MKIQLPAFVNVAANSVASCVPDIGPTFRRIYLQLGGGAFVYSDITRIVCKINQKIMYDITGAHLALINAYKGIPAETTFLTLDFTEIKALSQGGMYLGGIGTGEGVLNGGFTIDVHIAGATTPTLAAVADVGPPTPLGSINALIPYTANFAVAGKFPVDLPHGAGAAMVLKRVAMFPSANNITFINVKKNGYEILEDMSTANFEHFQKEYGKVPQADLYVYDPVVNDDMSQVVNLQDAKSFRVFPTVDGAMSLVMYTDVITTIDQL